jgi:hypothetical protein
MLEGDTISQVRPQRERNSNVLRAEVTTLGKFELGTWAVQTVVVCSSVDSLGVTDGLLLFYLTRVPFPVNSTQKYDIFLKKSSRESFHNLCSVSTVPGAPQTTSRVHCNNHSPKQCRFKRVLTDWLSLCTVYMVIKKIP